MHTYVLLCLVLLAVTSAFAAPGDLDPAFGSGGIVSTTIDGLPTTSEEMLVQPDGKIVVCGWILDNDGNGSGFYLARYQPSGVLDSSFGTNGRIIGFLSSRALFPRGITLQPDGKIIAVGPVAWYSSADYGFGIHRYNANGTLDASFGTGGVVITPGQYGYAESVAVQADGKIVVVGQNHQPSGADDLTVVRLQPDGSLDTSFNGTGIVTTSFGYSSYAAKVILQPDGKIVAVGGAGNVSALVRYNADGSLDSGFGAGGKVIHAISDYSGFADAVLQPDGKIVASGYFYPSNDTQYRTAIVRYNTNGSIDTSFAANGIFKTTSSLNVGAGIALQSDGKLVAFGSASNDEQFGGYAFAVGRLNPNGTWDLGFHGGSVVTPFERSTYATDGAVQPDGKILAFGRTAFDYVSEISIVRYLGDSVAAPLPTQFDFDGDHRADVSVFRPSDGIWYLDQSTNGFSATQFGLSTDRITPADFDGDGKADISVYRDGVWYWLNSSNGNFNALQFGLAGDIPVPADYTGDGRDEIAIYRAGEWWTLDLSGGQVSEVTFGISTDKPVPADYDGDGKVDQAVYRGGEWHLNRSSQGYTAVQFGIATDEPVVGDYDGDSKADPAVYRDGVWYLLQSTNGFAAFQWGLASDIPACADYDGDGKTDAAVYRDGIWWVWRSTGGYNAVQFGLAGDTPLPNAYVP